MYFEFTVQVEADRIEGKFESRDSIGEAIREALDDADPGTLEGENDGSYETTTWDVEDTTPTKRGKK